MFANYVNRHDLTRVARKLERGQVDKVLSKLRIRGKARVTAHWANIDAGTQEWWAIKGVQRRWNTFASGDPDVSFPMYAARTHLGDRSRLTALSLGCGTGGNEINWAKQEVFAEILGIDIAPERIDAANRGAKEHGLEDHLRFEVADAHDLIKANQTYDVVLGLQSLHHFEHLDETMEWVAKLIAPGGYLMVDEFVGPTRFQWTRQQIAVANDLLARLPEERRRMSDGRIKDKVIRPSKLSMIIDDPSEAVDSERLLPAIEDNFEILEVLPYGGSVLHIALSGISHNFLDDDAETQELIEMCFAAEDKALENGLEHDFVFMVCRPR